MGNKLYKYIGPDVLEKAFHKENECRFKCSYPRDFNDPYELFLTIGFNQKPDILAFYAETIDEVPQRATTCYSKYPSVIPMWAHYAHGHRGLVIEVDEEKVQEELPEVGFGDVDYRDEPHDHILDHLHRAFVTGKPRHTYFLWQAVMSSAYYTKRTCWNYEQERRLVSPDSYIEESSELMLLPVSNESVTAIISGANAHPDTVAAAKLISKKYDCSYYQMIIGRTISEPYFVGQSGSYSFENGEIRVSAQKCSVCKEPTVIEAGMCAWCAINDSHRKNAARSNPMRALGGAGMLEDYIAQMQKIGRGQSE